MSEALQTARAYVALTKPGIISLLLVTTVPAMVLAERGWPSTWLVVARFKTSATRPAVC